MTGTVYNIKGPSEAGRYVYAHFDTPGIAFKAFIGDTEVGYKNATKKNTEDLLLDPEGRTSYVSGTDSDTTPDALTDLYSLLYPYGTPRYWIRPATKDNDHVVVTVHTEGYKTHVRHSGTTIYTSSIFQEIVVAAATFYEQPNPPTPTVEKLWVICYGLRLGGNNTHVFDGTYTIRTFRITAVEQSRTPISEVSGVLYGNFCSEKSGPPPISMHPDGTHGVFICNDVGDAISDDLYVPYVQFERPPKLGKIFKDGTFLFTDITVSGGAGGARTNSGSHDNSVATSTGSGSTPPIPYYVEYAEDGTLLQATISSEAVQDYRYTRVRTTSYTHNVTETEVSPGEFEYVLDERSAESVKVASSTINSGNAAIKLWGDVSVPLIEYSENTQYTLDGASELLNNMTYRKYRGASTWHSCSGGGSWLRDVVWTSPSSRKFINRELICLSLKSRFAAFLVNTTELEGYDGDNGYTHSSASTTPCSGGIDGTSVIHRQSGKGFPTYGHLEVYYGDSVFVGEKELTNPDQAYLSGSVTDGNSICTDNPYSPQFETYGPFIPFDNSASAAGYMTLFGVAGPLVYPTMPLIDRFNHPSCVMHSIRMGNLSFSSFPKLTGMFGPSNWVPPGHYSDPQVAHVLSHGAPVQPGVESVVSGELSSPISAITKVTLVRPV